jgi:beta-glucosidase
MKQFRRFATMILTVITLSVSAQNTHDLKMKTFVDALMKKMTLEEKLGQLNLPGAGDITTGQAKSSDIAQKIREGKVGGLFNNGCDTWL